MCRAVTYWQNHLLRQGQKNGIEIGKAEVLKKAVALGFGKGDIQRLFGISSKEYLKMVAGKA